ncbi:MAG: hypothetical protein IT443_10350 [Phycisphaeraceae bacterium]|nr:hypothetical protein [Phycisphaeraceae bacterium]
MPKEAKTLVEATVWTDAAHAPVAAGILDRMREWVKPIGVGGPRGAELDDLSRRSGCPYHDDLRKLLIDHPSSYVLLAHPAGMKREDLLLAMEQDSVVLCLEPALADISEIADLQAGKTGGKRAAAGDDSGVPGIPGVWSKVVRIPHFLGSPGWESAANPLEALGTPLNMSLVNLGRRQDGSLYALLLDAWHTVLALVDLPVSIEASLISPRQGAAIGAKTAGGAGAAGTAAAGGIAAEKPVISGDVPESVRAMTGHLTAHARLSHGRGVAIQVSNQAGITHRTLWAIGESGLLAISDYKYALYDKSGKVLDHLAPTAGQGKEGLGQADEQGAVYTDLVAWEWRKLIERSVVGGFSAKPGIEGQALACCLASLLSCRTGQPENPQNLLTLGVGG